MLNGIARSMASCGLKKALSFRIVELALRDDAVMSYPPARGQQWPLQQCFVPELVEHLVEVLKARYQDGLQQPTAERVVEVPKISCQECIEALKGVPQERSSEEKFEVHTSSPNGFWRRTVHRLRSRVNERNSGLPSKLLGFKESNGRVPRQNPMSQCPVMKLGLLESKKQCHYRIRYRSVLG